MGVNEELIEEIQSVFDRYEEDVKAIIEKHGEEEVGKALNTILKRQDALKMREYIRNNPRIQEMFGDLSEDDQEEALDFVEKLLDMDLSELEEAIMQRIREEEGDAQERVKLTDL